MQPATRSKSETVHLGDRLHEYFAFSDRVGRPFQRLTGSVRSMNWRSFENRPPDTAGDRRSEHDPNSELGPQHNVQWLKIDS